MITGTIESTIEAIRDDLRRRHQPIMERAAKVRAALDAYVAAVDADLASKLRVILGLGSPSGEHVGSAAHDLRVSLDALLADTPTEPSQQDAPVDGAAEASALLADLLKHGSFEAVPDDLFRAYAEEYAARARLVQESLGERDREAPEVRAIRKLTAMASRRAIYDIFGLNRSHHDDWAGRVEHARRKRAGLEAKSRPESEANGAEILGSEVDEPLDLPGLRLVAERSAIVLVGGEQDAQKLARLRRRSGIDIEWTPGGTGPRLARRVRDGHVGAVVILNGLVSHGDLGPLMEAMRCHAVPVAYGWKAGLGSITTALRDLERRLAAVTPTNVVQEP